MNYKNMIDSELLELYENEVQKQRETKTHHNLTPVGKTRISKSNTGKVKFDLTAIRQELLKRKLI